MGRAPSLIPRPVAMSCRDSSTWRKAICASLKSSPPPCGRMWLQIYRFLRRKHSFVSLFFISVAKIVEKIIFPMAGIRDFYSSRVTIKDYLAHVPSSKSFKHDILPFDGQFYSESKFVFMDVQFTSDGNGTLCHRAIANPFGVILV